MGSRQQFCLRWNNYQSNLSTVFEQLLQTEAFVDVTLACQGNAVIKCHKMVLSACSPYFQSLLMENPCQHPIVILKDLRYEELRTLVEFMYKGEINVLQDQIPSLLKLAETLKIKGLAEVRNEECKPGSPPKDNIGSCGTGTHPLPPPAVPVPPPPPGAPPPMITMTRPPPPASLVPSLVMNGPKRRRLSYSGLDSGCGSPAELLETNLELHHPQALLPHPLPRPEPSMSQDEEIRPAIAEMIKEEERAMLMENAKMLDNSVVSENGHSSCGIPAGPWNPIAQPSAPGIIDWPKENEACDEHPNEVDEMCSDPSFKCDSQHGVGMEEDISPPYPETGKGFFLTKESREAAIRKGMDLVQQGISIKRAAVECNIPVMTLWRRAKQGGLLTNKRHHSVQYQMQNLWQKAWAQNQSLIQNLRFRERGPFKSWKPETMASAIRGVLNEGLSLSEAARKHDIPYPTFVLYANKVHNMLGPSPGGSELRPKGRGRPQRILLGSWPEDQVESVIRAVVFRETANSIPYSGSPQGRVSMSPVASPYCNSPPEMNQEENSEQSLGEGDLVVKMKTEHGSGTMTIQESEDSADIISDTPPIPITTLDETPTFASITTMEGQDH